MKRATIVGSGPNGLCAAITLAMAGVHVTVLEAADTPGGSVRTEETTLPGFLHDIGAAVFPLTIASPFLRSLPLTDHGLQWIEPDVPVAHPLENGDAVAQLHDLQATAELLREDGAAWTRLMRPTLDAWPDLLGDVLAPMIHMTHHPSALARFGMKALQSAEHLAMSQFSTERARALFAGLAGHSNVPLRFAASSAPGLILAAAAHTSGWPIAKGGAGAITSALVSYLRSLGGEVQLGVHVESLQALSGDAILLDLTPRQYLALAGGRSSTSEQKSFSDFRPSPGICKVDWALSAPVPWTAELCRRAGTVHLGASLPEIASSESDAWEGRESERPYVLLSQPSLFDALRAPAGHHTAWAYCHVPYGSVSDFTARIEAQIERYAPGFRNIILARQTRTAPQMQAWNPNLLGGDISGGAMTLKQILRRPSLPPYRTSIPGVFLCSSSTPPGGGVHGMCGYFAATVAAKHMGIRVATLFKSER